MFFPINPFRNHSVFDFPHFDVSYSSDDSSTLKKVDDCLAKNDGAGALRAANNFFGFSGGNEAYRKIADFHIARGELNEAANAVGYICSGYKRDQMFKQIFSLQLDKNDLEGARNTAGRIISFVSRDAATKKVFDLMYANGDVKGAKNVASEMMLTNRTASFDKILNRELGENDFKGAIDTCAQIGTERAANKVAEGIKEAFPEPAVLKEIEKTASAKLSLFPRLEKIILTMLMSIFEALGDQPEVDRLQKKIDHLELWIMPSHWESIKKPVALLAGSYAGMLALTSEVAPPVAAAVGVGTALAVAYPAARRGENLLGVGAGAAAAAAGMAALPAIGVGVGTAFVTRIPVVQALAQGTLETGMALIEGGVNGMEWTMENVFVPVVQGTFNGIGTVAEGVVNGVANAGAFVFSGAGSLLTAVDSVFDTLTFNK